MRISGSVGCPAGASGPAARRGLSSVGAGGMAQDFQFLWRELWPARPQGAHTESSVVVVDRASARGEVILMYICPRSHLPGKAARVRIEHGILSPLVVIDKRCLSGTPHRRPDCRRYRLLPRCGPFFVSCTVVALQSRNSQLHCCSISHPFVCLRHSGSGLPSCNPIILSQLTD